MNNMHTIRKALQAMFFCLTASPAIAQNEYPIDACVHKLVNNVYKTRANNFNRYFKCRTSFQQWQCDTLMRTDFDSLKSLLYTSNNRHRNDSFFYAFHVFYGLDDTTIRLVYVPVFADFAGVNNTTGAWEFGLSPAVPNTSLNDTLDNSLYAFVRENGKLTRKYAKDVLPLLHNYAEHISIDAAGNNQWRGFVDMTDATGDAKAILFPFQVIDALFAEGLNNENFDRVYVLNIAEHDEINGLNMYKHSIAFSPVMPNDPNPAPVAENLGSLYPPGAINSYIQMADHRPAPPYTYFGY